MRAHQSTATNHERSPTGGMRVHPLDSYGMVLVLIILDYVAISTLTDNKWGTILIVLLLSGTVLFTLRTSHATRIWQLLAAIYLLASTLVTLVSAATEQGKGFSQFMSIVGGLLLIVTPFVILRRISTHTVVTNETVLGAVCVYLLLGFSFAFIYTAIGFYGSMPFFEGQVQATPTNYLFFSYTTLTTVGYGNLVPAGSVGQTFAMLEALSGQIYLVIVVARLVSLWGQARSTQFQRGDQASSDSVQPDGSRSPSAGADTRDNTH